MRGGSWYTLLGAILLLSITAACKPSYSAGTSNQGKIEFGSDYTKDFTIVHPKTVFRRGENIAWVAHLSQQAGSTTLTRIIYKLGPNKTQTIVLTKQISIGDSKDDTLAIKLPVGDLIDDGVRPPGMFILRYYRDRTKLAQGTFRLRRAGPGAAPGTLPISTPTPLATQGPAPPVSPPPRRAGQALLDQNGVGIATTRKFETPRNEWTLSWSYDCTSFGGPGNFVVSVYDTDGTLSQNNTGVNQQGKSGTGTSRFHTGGTYYLAINSQCNWHVTARG